MNATRCLREEHQVILKLLDCFEIALREAAESKKIDPELFGKFTEFFRGFADHCHHCKEEQRLFPVLESAGIPREGGPIGVMIAEHTQARHHVSMIADETAAAAEGDSAALGRLVNEGEMFIDLLRTHIMKENHVLFEMADGVLDDNAVSGLEAAYNDAASASEYCAKIVRCRAIALELTDRYGVPLPLSI